MQPIIQTDHLTKRYKGFLAVDDVSLKIKKGEIYGFIGLNGAGKTTTIRMLLAMIRPTKGRCYLDGEKVSIHHHAIWDKIGYMVETPHSYPELSVEENLDIIRRLRFLSNPTVVKQVMNRLKLTRYAKKKAKHLSLGNAQRLGIAKALLHEPEILILDEPVNGLDPAGIVEIRDLLQELAFNKGVTILISSHLLDEMAKMATKIGIIHEGRLIQEIETIHLNKRLDRSLLVDTRDNHSAVLEMSNSGYAAEIDRSGSIMTYHEQAIHHPEKISRLLVQKGFPPTRLLVEEENLESYFLRVIKKEGEISQ